MSPPGVTETVTVTADAPALDLSSARMGVNVSEREVQDLPINGRQMSQLFLQAPGSVNTGTGTWQDIRFSGRAVEQNVLRYDGVEGSAIIDAAPGNLNGEIPRRSSCRRASRTCRSSASSRTASRPNSARAPAARSTSSPSRAATPSTARCSSTSATTRSTRRTTSTPPRRPAEVAAHAAPVRRVARRPDRQGPRVLLRQLRRLPAECRLELRRSGPQPGGVGPGGAGSRCPAPRLPVAERDHPGRRVDEPGLRHRPAAGRIRT